jgi:hypothetical protein
LALASHPASATSSPPARIIRGSIGVKAKRPMPIATASTSRPAMQTARKEGRAATREVFDMGSH